jgi:hypothetical protein
MLSTGLIETLEQAAATYHDQLANGVNLTGRRGAIDYLDRRRIAGDVITEFRLGYVAEPLPGDELYAGRIAIPYLTPAGVRAIKYRCIRDHDCKATGHGHAKYMQPEGQEQRLYNVAAYHSGRDVLGVAEGELDALTATVHLDLPTIGVPGAQQWAKHGPYWRLALVDFSLVLIFVDGDLPRCCCTPRHQTGCPDPKRAGLELAKQIYVDAVNARIVRLPDGEDVNSMVVAGRIDELRKQVLI